MTDTPHTPTFPPMVERFRGYLPVVVDVETGGFDWNKHALLEIAAVPIELDEAGNYMPGAVAHAHIAPAPGTSIDPRPREVALYDEIYQRYRALYPALKGALA